MNMSFREEPESQIDSQCDQPTTEATSSIPLGSNSHDQAPPKLKPSHNEDDANSSEVVPEVDASPISSQILQHEALKSQVDETQFVFVERDSQPLTDCDLSPMTRKFLINNTESNTLEPPISMLGVSFLERPSVSKVPNLSDFRFAKPPQPSNMKLTRKPPGQTHPGQLEPIDLANSVVTQDDLLTIECDGTPHLAAAVKKSRSVSMSTRYMTTTPPISDQRSYDAFGAEEAKKDSSPDTLINTIHSQGKMQTQRQDISSVGDSLFGSQPSSTVLDIPQTTAGMVTSSHSSHNRRRFEDSMPQQNTKTCEEHFTNIKPVNFANLVLQPSDQLGKEVKAKPPPFNVASTGSSFMSENIEPQLLTRNSTTVKFSSAGPIMQKAGQRLVSKPGQSVHHPEIELSGNSDIIEDLNQTNDTEQPASVVQVLTNSMEHETSEKGCGQPDKFSGGSPVSSRRALTHLSRIDRTRSQDKQAIDKFLSQGYHVRPLSKLHSQPEGIHQTKGFHISRDVRGPRKGQPRANTQQRVQSDCNDQIAENDTITAEGLFQMAAVMFTAEKEQLDETITKIRLQESRIDDLSNENATLNYRIERLSEENQKLVKKNAGFRSRCEQYKANMNDVMRIQKALKADAKEINLRTLEVLREERKEMEAKLLEAKSHALNNSKTTLKEARLELARQAASIEILNRDINHQLLDLQRERGLRETLQKQLENQERQQMELKDLLSDHQCNTVSILSNHELIIRSIVNIGEESVLRLNECQTLLKTFNENELKPNPAVIQLNDLVVKLSERAQETFQAVENGNILMQDTGAKVLSEFKQHVNLISEDQSSKHKLNLSIIDLREENVRVKERLQNREKEIIRVENSLNEMKEELQNCQAQLVIANENLSKVNVAQQEDAFIRTQLRDLQKSYNIAKEEAETSITETEKVRLDFHKQERLTSLAQQEIAKLQEMLQQSEAKVSELDSQKATYARQRKEESAALRLSMEQVCQARLADDEIRHDHIISGLRRQVMEADSKLSQCQKSLCDAEIALSKEDAISKISEQISMVDVELGNLKEKARLMVQTGGQTSTKLCLAEEKLTQCMKKSVDWAQRMEKNAIECSKQPKELVEHEDTAEKERDRLKSLILVLEEKNSNCEALISQITRHLIATGVFEAGLTISEWAGGLPPERVNQINKSTENLLLNISNMRDDTAAPYQKGSGRSSQQSLDLSNMQSSNDQTNVFAGSPRKYMHHTMTFEGYERRLTETKVSYLPSHCRPLGKATGWDDETENRLPLGSLHFPGGVYRSGNAQRPFSGTNDAFHLHFGAIEQALDPKLVFNDAGKLEGAPVTMIPDSQDCMEHVQDSNFVKPIRVAERSHDLAQSRTNQIRTEVMEHDILISENLNTTLAVRCSDTNHTLSEGLTTGFGNIGLTEDSSDLSEPPENLDGLDFAQFMESGDENEATAVASLPLSEERACIKSMASSCMESMKSNSGRARTGSIVRQPEAKVPKGILKRTNSIIQEDDVDTASHSSRRTIGNLKSEDNYQASETKKQSNKTMSKPNSRETTINRPQYNRPVEGVKNSHSRSKFLSTNLQTQQQRPSPSKIYPTSSSPAMGQPQRNSRKRSISNVCADSSNRQVKVSRSIKH